MKFAYRIEFISNLKKVDEFLAFVRFLDVYLKMKPLISLGIFSRSSIAEDWGDRICYTWHLRVASESI